MRAGLVFLVLAACGRVGPSVDPRPDGGVIIAPDGRIIALADAPDGEGDGPGADPEPDATVELTECQQATQHSDLAWIQQKVFTPSCATAMCHAGNDPEVGLNLEVGRAYVNLVNRNSSTQPGWVRVVPGALSTSYIVVALGRTDGPPPRDGFMPLGAAALCIEKHEAVERWILAGAPN